MRPLFENESQLNGQSNIESTYQLLREGPPENQAKKRHLAGEKFLIFDLPILK